MNKAEFQENLLLLIKNENKITKNLIETNKELLKNNDNDKNIMSLASLSFIFYFYLSDVIFLNSSVFSFETMTDKMFITSIFLGMGVLFVSLCTSFILDLFFSKILTKQCDDNYFFISAKKKSIEKFKKRKIKLKNSKNLLKSIFTQNLSRKIKISKIVQKNNYCRTSSEKIVDLLIYEYGKTNNLETILKDVSEVVLNNYDSIKNERFKNCLLEKIKNGYKKVNKDLEEKRILAELSKGQESKEVKEIDLKINKNKKLQILSI